MPRSPVRHDCDRLSPAEHGTVELTPYLLLVISCVHHSHLFSFVSNALFLSYNEKGRIAEILASLPDDFEISVVTDGSRILGLGDLGVDGVGASFLLLHSSS